MGSRYTIKDKAFCRFGTPRVILTDKGSQFASKIMNNLYTQWNVKQIFIKI